MDTVSGGVLDHEGKDIPMTRRSLHSQSLPVNLCADEILPRPQGGSVLSKVGQLARVSGRWNTNGLSIIAGLNEVTSGWGNDMPAGDGFCSFRNSEKGGHRGKAP